MPGFSGIPDGVPHTVLTDISASCASAGMALMEKRSRALADYWRAFAAVRDPSEALALNFGYATEMMDDYARAYSEAVTPATAEPQAPEAAPAQASQAA